MYSVPPMHCCRPCLMHYSYEKNLHYYATQILVRVVAAMASYCFDATRCQTMRLNLSLEPWLWLALVMVI